MELSALSYFFRVLIEGDQGALPLRPQQGAALHPRRVFDPLDTHFAMELSALTYFFRVLIGARKRRFGVYAESPFSLDFADGAEIGRASCRERV